MLVWDFGGYRALDEHRSIADAIRHGHVGISLEGKKLKGGFVLTRIGTGRRERWPLVKMDDAEAGRGAEPVEDAPASVLSGPDLADVAADWRRGRHPRAP